MIKIRRAREDEIDEILDLDRVLFSPGYFPPAQGGDVAWWIAEEDGHTVGYAAAKPCKGDPECLYLSRVGVVKAARGRGLQRRLIRARERWGRSQGAIFSVSDTNFDNVASTRSLIACGYRPFLPKDPWAGKYSTYWKREIAAPQKVPSGHKADHTQQNSRKPSDSRSILGTIVHVEDLSPDLKIIDPYGMWSEKP